MYLYHQLQAINYILDLNDTLPSSSSSLTIKPYVYKLTHKTTGHFYFGYRERNVGANRCAKDDLGIHYFSGSEKIKEIGFENFNYEIICECDSDSRAYDIEQVLIMLNFNNPLNLNGFYINIFAGKKRFKTYKGQGKGLKRTQEQTDRRKKLFKERGGFSEITLERMRKPKNHQKR